MKTKSLILVLALAGCAGGDDNGPEGTGDPQNVDRWWEADLSPELIQARPFGLKIPSGYDGTPLPLIVTLHGLGSSGYEQAQYSGLLAQAESRKFLLAYPDGVQLYGVRGWNASFTGKITIGDDDITYLRALIADVASKYSVDKKQIHLQGISNGAFMAYALACTSADLIAAIAPLSGTMWAGEEDVCNPSTPVAVHHTHGTNDGTIGYTGGTVSYGLISLDYISANNTVDAWVSMNGCDTTPATDTFDSVNSIAGNDTDIERYTGCTNERDVEFWTINNGPHVPYLTPEYWTEVVDFLLNHPKP